jgi:hypothetical protein
MSRLTTSTTSVKSSELSRNPNHVFSAAEQGRVAVTRRDGGTLILDTEERVRDTELMLEIAAQLIAASLDDEPIARGMITHFPWIAVLDADEQQDCVAEIVRSARAAFSLHRPLPLLTAIEAWRNTAEAIAAGTAVIPVSWLDDEIPVDRPDA